uniref:Putative secreted protein n=1 Tax=Anopheles darlingi TaxID=43151 RepID=A0A2M4DR43_ANODA
MSVARPFCCPPAAVAAVRLVRTAPLPSPVRSLSGPNHRSGCCVSFFFFGEDLPATKATCPNGCSGCVLD